MRILHIEDAAPIALQMHDVLREAGHEVFDAIAIPGAEDMWNVAESTNKKFDCIILDLQLPMPKEWTKERHNIPISENLAGWIWYKDWLLPKYPEMRERTIIYSGYLNDLLETARIEELSGLRLVPKTTGGAKKLMMYTEEISKLSKRGA